MMYQEILTVLLESARNSNVRIGARVSFTIGNLEKNRWVEHNAKAFFRKEFGVELECCGTNNCRHFNFVLTQEMKVPIHIPKHPQLYRPKYISRRGSFQPSFA